MKISDLINLSDDFWSKVTFNKCSAAMGFQIGFKSVGFFFVFKGYCVFDPPWSEFRCMRHIAFVVFFQTGSQIFGTADVEMGSGCFVNEDVNVMIVRHNLEVFRKMFAVMQCCIVRLHLLPQITPRQSSPPGSLCNPFATQLACRGEISALPR